MKPYTVNLLYMYIFCLLFIPFFFFNGINKSVTWLACITVCSGTGVGKHCDLLTQRLVTSGSYHTNVNKQTVHQTFRQPQSRFLQRNAKHKQTTEPTLGEPQLGFWQRNANNKQTVHPTLGEPHLVVFKLRNANNKLRAQHWVNLSCCF